MRLKAYLTRRLRRLLDAVLLSAVICTTALVAACGGGGGDGGGGPATPPPPPVQSQAPTTIDRYIPMFFGGRTKGVIVKQETGEKYTEWLAQPGLIRWSPLDAEALDQRYCMGRRWSFLTGFVDDRVHQTWHLINVKTTLNGVLLDCPQDGAPYQPWDIPADGRDEVEQWGTVEGNQQFYWKATFIYGTVATNPCWIGDGPKTRPVIVQSEVWWSSNGGWVRGHPVDPTRLPWVDGKPVSPGDVVMEWEVKNAADAGILWVGGSETLHLCLRETGAW